MQIILRTIPAMVIADEGMKLRDINDVYVPEHIDPETHEIIPEHIPHYSDVVFIPNNLTEEQVREMYVEETVIENE